MSSAFSRGRPVRWFCKYCAGCPLAESQTIQVLLGSIRHSNRSCRFDNFPSPRLGEVLKAALLNEFLAGIKRTELG